MTTQEVDTGNACVGVYNISVVIEEVAKHTKDIEPCRGKDVIVCLGKTQSGKSTLYNSLAHGVLDYGNTDKGVRLVPVSEKMKNAGYPVAGTGDGVFSETIYPCAYPLPGGQVFLDTRGFCDVSRDSCAEAAAAILTDIAIRQAKSVKIIWVQPYSLLSGSLTDLDTIGAVLNKVVYVGAPILFLFNKNLELKLEDASPEGRRKFKKEKSIIDIVDSHEIGESEDVWPEFHEIALREIKKRINHIFETDKAKSDELLKKLRGRAGAVTASCWSDDIIDTLVESDPSFVHVEERASYLAHFSDSFHAGRVQYVDPRFQVSIDWLKNALRQLAPALGAGSPSSIGSTSKALNFSDYCPELVRFREDFNSRLRDFVIMLKWRSMNRDNPIDPSEIHNKMKEVEKHEKNLADISQGIDLIKYEEMYLKRKGTWLSANLADKERLECRVKEIDSEIQRIEEGEPFVDCITFSKFKLFGRASCTVTYDKEEFLSFRERLSPNTTQGKVTSTKPPRFEVEYIADETNFFRFLSQTIKDKVDLSSINWTDIIKGKISFEDVCKILDTAWTVGSGAYEYFTKKRCEGSVEFLIDSSVHNRLLIEDKRQEKLTQLKNIEMKEREIIESNAAKSLVEAVKREIEKLKKEVTMIRAIGNMREELERVLQKKMPMEGGKFVTLEQIIYGCKPVVEEFFRQNDGIQQEFLRVLNERPHAARESLDVLSLFNDTVHYIQQLQPHFPSFGDLLKNGGSF